MSESSADPLDALIESRRFRLGDIELHAKVGGPEDGPLVILLHGAPAYWRSWKHQIPALVEAGYRVVAPDMRGYNLSDKPVGTTHYRYDALAGDVVGLVRAMGREKTHIVGHDWGGMVSWWFLLKYPEMVDRAVLMNIPHPVVMYRGLATSLRQLRASWYIVFFQLPWLPERILRRNDYSGVRKAFESARPGAFTEEDMAGYKRSWEQPGAIRGMLSYYRASARRPSERPASFKAQPPLLLIWGKDDVALTEQLAHQSIEFCADGRLELLEASHWVQNDAPERVNALLLDHLAG